MEKIDFEILSRRTKADGKRLFDVCELIYKLAIFIIWIVAAIGTIATIMALQKSAAVALAVGLGTAIFCFLNYMLAVLSTHVAKVMVHNSFATLGLLEHFTNQEDSN